MSQTLQLEETAVTAHDSPKLLVEWSSPWHEFVTAIRPALRRSDARLAGEAPFGLVPFRIMIPSYVLELFLIFAVIVVQVKIAEMRPYVAPRFSSHDVIYYSGDELPRTEDLGGAQSAATGRAGGDEAHHRTQTIKIARGGSLVPKVVDAPNLKLPSSQDAVANLLAIKPNPGPPPLEGLRSLRRAPNLSTAVVAPAPNVIHDYTRNGVALEAVIAPAPTVQRDQILTAPNLSATVIPPAPGVSRDNVLVAPVLVPAVILPAPSVSRDRRNAPSLSPSVVAPAPSVARDATRSAPALAANVIPPAPGSVTRDLSSAPVQMTNVAVVPPPVSAPERASARNPKLSMPAPAVIAPPPSADISQDLHRIASSVPDPSKAVVPPPPTQQGSGSFMSSLMGKIFGASEVVPPPPAVSSNGTGGGARTSLTANVVPPPPSVGTPASGVDSRGTRDGGNATLSPNVIAPPPSSGMAGGSGSRPVASSAAPALGLPSVVPPPPSLSGAGGGTGNTGGGAGSPGGTLLVNNIVPPPPSVSGGVNSPGNGAGRRGVGLGAPLEVGAPAAPPSSGGSGGTSSAVISSQPGSKVGLPTTGSTGSLAISPSGGDKTGVGGSGGGKSIGRGNGPGSSLTGEGSGAGKSGPGRGSDTNAHGGISPSPGPGGAGTAPDGTPPVPGVSVDGGKTVVTLPSFGSDPAAVNPTTPGHSTPKSGHSFDVDIVATATSGGAFAPYKNLLHGEKHTIYPDTSSSTGTAVMEYADETAGRGNVTPPASIRTNLPEGLPHLRMVVLCTLDASGNVKNARVLEAGTAEMTAKVLAALRGWKFQPALRAGQPVEVTAILGFNIDTNDRF